MSDYTSLDTPVWKALNGKHAEFAVKERDIPFLNVMTQNVGAVKINKKLGFTKRKEYSFNGYTRL